MIASGPLILTFAKVQAEKGCECQNWTTSDRKARAWRLADPGANLARTIAASAPIATPPIPPENASSPLICAACEPPQGPLRVRRRKGPRCRKALKKRPSPCPKAQAAGHTANGRQAPQIVRGPRNRGADCPGVRDHRVA